MQKLIFINSMIQVKIIETLTIKVLKIIMAKGDVKNSKIIIFVIKY